MSEAAFADLSASLRSELPSELPSHLRSDPRTDSRSDPRADALPQFHPRRLRIGLLTHSVNPRGGVVHTLELARALHDAGHAVTVFAPASIGQRLFRTVPFEVELVAVAPAQHDVAQLVESRIVAFEIHLADRVARTRFDVLHAQDPIGANALANLQDRGLIDGFVRTVHHLDTFDDPRLMAWQRRGFERATQVFCVSRLWCDILLRAHGIDAALVHNGVDCERFSRCADADADADADDGGNAGGNAGVDGPADDASLLDHLRLRAGVRRGAPVFLAVGGIEERKNSLRILEAFLLVRLRWPGAQLVIAGGASLLDHDAYAQQFRQAVTDAGLATGPGEPLLLAGTLPDAVMPALFRRADALVMPSLREGFGLAVLESLASGTPVVVSNVAPFTEYLTDADCCWANPHDAWSIADAMLAALDPSRAEALAAVIPAVCLRFNWAASAARHVALYRGHRRTPTCP